MNSRAVTAPTRTLGDYGVLYELKSGGMGEVLLARKRGAAGFEKLVAIKTIRSELQQRDELRTAFLDEAQLVAQINHPAIAQVHDFGDQDGTLYLAMEYVPGIRFSELSRREPAAPVCALAMARALRGLHAAHTLCDLSGAPLNVVHRDVSPENLMVTFEGRVKVLDFGIALVRGRRAPVTEFGTIKGKPPYLSPEQIKNKPVDHRSDIFSAAVVLHEMLTGEQVYDGDSVYAVARAIECEEVLPPSSFVDGVPLGLDEVVMRGMERDPALRFQSAAEFADALERVCIHCGGEALDSYARRELASAAAEHRNWLRSVLEDRASRVGPAGRPSGVMTAQSQVVQTPVGEHGVSPPRQPSGRLPMADRVTLRSEELAVVRPRRMNWLVPVVLVVLIGGAVGWHFLRGSSPPMLDATAHAKPEAAVFDASVDANLVVPADATAGVDAVHAPVVVVRTDRHANRIREARRKARQRERTGTSAGKVRAGSERPAEPTRQSVRTPADAGIVAYGYVRIAATPFASVVLDGKRIGHTPILRRRVRVGRHIVVLLNPEDGSVRARGSVVVKPGKLATFIR